MKKLHSLVLMIFLTGCMLISDNATHVMNAKCLFGKAFEVQIKNGVIYSDKVPVPIGFIEKIDKNKVMFSREVDSEIKRYILDIKKEGNIYVVGIERLEFFRCK